VSAAVDGVREPASIRVSGAEMRSLLAEILSRAGADAQAAELVAGSLVASDECGVHSHGSMRIGDYVAGIRAGKIAPMARPRVLAGRGPFRSLAGMSAFGQVAARELVARVIDGTREHGVCLGTLSGVAHIGRLGEWVEHVVAEGYIALAWCNCGDPGGNVAPFGGRAARLGTNPIAYGIPAGSRDAIIADFSTSIAAEGKIRLHKHAGEALPDGWVIDADGRPSTDPNALYEGGALLPAGGHKGFALALLVEILGGVLAGGGCASLGEPAGNGLVLLAVDPERSAGRDGFGSRVAAVVEAIASVPPALDGSPVLIPGDPERAAARRSARGGFELSALTWQSITDAAHSVGVVLPTETRK
jgi:LDH2 family malate/lactate/ureidoglycolate dehydrogenase